MMKRIIQIMAVMLLGISFIPKADAQADEIAQLLLNVEKLAQFKKILSNMKTGYDILSKGYGTIKNISEGNFNMHQLFLDGLLEVSPTVRNYHKIAGVIEHQVLLLKEYKAAYKRLSEGGKFKPSELEYIASVYDNLLKQSLRNLDELTGVITAGKLRMSDDERLKAIDRIDDDMTDKLDFLRQFNNETSVLALQRGKALQDIKDTKKLYHLN